nr:flocculation protein FLO11-like [Crassostrea gigas]
MESSVGGSSEFHWGDCVLRADITDGFDSLLGYPVATACGYVSLDSLSLTACSSAVSLGFICENPSGEDSCFTTMSTTVYAMGYDSKTALTSSDCASHCLTSSSCGAVYVTAGSSCSMLQYNTGLPSRLSAPHLAYAHLYHRRFLNNDPYSLPFKAGLTEDELCSEPIGSPITTRAIGDVTTTIEINPTTTKEATTKQILEETTTDDVTTPPTTEDTTTEDVTTPTTVDTTTNDVTTPTTEDTTTEDVTTQTTGDTTSENVTTPTTEETTTEDITIKTTQDSTTQDVTTQTTGKISTTADVTTQTIQDTTTEHITTQTTEYTTTEHVTTKPVSELSTSKQIPVSNVSSCGCTCVKKNITINEKIEDMVSDLKVDISVLSATVRKKVCAEDPRPSARNVGILGIVLVTVMVGLIIAMDVMRFFQNDDRPKVMIKPDKKIVPAT